MAYPALSFDTGAGAMVIRHYTDIGAIGSAIIKAFKVFGVGYRHPTIHFTNARYGGNELEVFIHGFILTK